MQVSRHIKNSPLFSPKQFLYFWLCFLSETVTINLPSASQRDAMVAENDEMAIGIGWPLGLGFFNMRLRVVDSLPSAYSVAPYSLHIPSTSFSSFSSSNLDTEKQSSASFFQDKSVSLAQLIGATQGERESLYLSNSMRLEEERQKKLAKGSYNGSEEQSVEDMCRGICIPILLHTLQRISNKTKKTSRN
ncbi:uncharacterized protein [Arachis hypogaea]|uniref:uncharacterized protein isoform X1 n=1 Tax=Arachis hypogaea TaxID=3818 RepID=UPI000DEC4C8F|nr:uncharacterized protein LOC112714551 isoform X1 [Arachis hypogaea]